MLVQEGGGDLVGEVEFGPTAPSRRPSAVGAEPFVAGLVGLAKK